MSSKRYFVDKHDGTTGASQAPVSQVGGGSKTVAKANALKAQMRAVDAQRHGSNWYTVREGRK